MSVRVVIADDEKPARDRLRRLLAAHPDFMIVGEAGDGVSAVEVIDRERPDLVFLDVKMPEADGFEVLRRIRSLPRIIFTTAYDEFAVRAFEVASLDYLLKPFDRARFAVALDRAREAMTRRSDSPEQLREMLERIHGWLSQPGAAPPPRGGPDAPRPPATAPPQRVSAHRGAKILLLDPAEILWFEAEDVLVYARTVEGGRYLVDRPLADLEVDFTPGFFRAHRGYLVNLSKVAEILPGEAGTYRIIMRDEARSSVPLSRRQARLLRELIRW
jgi:DNA-binding LytR/AlgR family response regulator